MVKNRFFSWSGNAEKAGGILLLICTALSLTLANSGWGPGYQAFWQHPYLVFPGNGWVTPEGLINEGLMSLFFLLAGLEIRREWLTGHLASRKMAILPVMAAAGGMLLPALIHGWLNYNSPSARGFGIPMATDIAFSLAVLALIGGRLPPGLKVFLTAVAIIDDLGAVLVIVLFYSDRFSWAYFLTAVALAICMAAGRRKLKGKRWVYLIAGVFFWYLLFRSGIHPTLSGIIIALLLPFDRSDFRRSLAGKTEYHLQKPVAFLVVPLFALANTAIALPAGWYRELLSDNSMGISAGLIMGKCLGIAGFSLLAIKSGKAAWPAGMNTRLLVGAGFLGGIGFTMSVFISHLAFPQDPARIESSKVAVLCASFCSALLGWAVLRSGHPASPNPEIRNQ